MSIRHMHRTTAFALCISVALTGCAGCGAPGGASQSDSSASSSSSASTQNNGAKIAPTLKDYIQSLLDADKGTMSDQQRSALERAVQNDGKVSRSDYERAWSDYRQCIVDKGYSVPELQRYSSGVYALPSYDTSKATREQTSKLNEDLVTCDQLHITNIDTVYKLQIGNPTLSTNSSAVAVDCLRRENVKPKSYTVEQLEKDLVSDHNGLTNNAKALDCLVTSGVNVTPADETPWQPFQ